MSLQHAAKYIASHGRDGDTMLVHMTPNEVGSLQALAKANGGTLSVNPNTGLPEASFLSGLLPMVIGGGLMAMSGGAINPMTAGLLVGGLQTARTGSLQKGLLAGFGAYGGAGLASGLAGAGASSLAAESAGAAFDPTTMATAGQGASMGATPNVMSMEQLTAAHPEATMAELDTAQQAQTAARNATLEQQTAANVLKPQQLGQTVEQIKTTTPMVEQLRAGLGSVTASPTAGLSFLGDNARSAFSAAAPVAAGISTGAAPKPSSSGPNPYKYQYEPNVSSPFPTPDVPGYGDQGQNFGRERRYFDGRYVPEMAGGGPVEAMSNANAVGANTGYPMANIRHGAYATPYQQPISQNVVTGDQDTRVDPYTGQERLAKGGAALAGGGSIDLHGTVNLGDGGGGGGGGGDREFGQISANGYMAAGSNGGGMMGGGFDPRAIAANPQGFQQYMLDAQNREQQTPGSTFLSQMGQARPGAFNRFGATLAAGGIARSGVYDLGGYSDGGRLLRGPGDGVSDSIPATIGDKQPARLADGEFVVPARIVSELGNGSTEAGARKLYAMMERVQKARGKTTGKGKIAKNTRADKFLPA